MNVEDLLAKIQLFKAAHPDCAFSLTVEEVKDLDERFGELYLLAMSDETEEAELISDELLLSVEKPRKQDLEELRGIAAMLSDFI
ncbi:hypothetical protein [Jeotgalibaca caeni]|uniref:hypothetical protein n=1 Tax=Jeotgalibaca caeni TaxID=3028623 RepID=UPI00237D7873|nr:hypothetical protein [Jeotgalibaca caeni]MDE1548333.1 hypothetical protein [Jeotgalibaca caeni]